MLSYFGKDDNTWCCRVFWVRACRRFKLLVCSHRVVSNSLVCGKKKVCPPYFSRFVTVGLVIRERKCLFVLKPGEVQTTDGTRPWPYNHKLITADHRSTHSDLSAGPIEMLLEVSKNQFPLTFDHFSSSEDAAP